MVSGVENEARNRPIPGNLEVDDVATELRDRIFTYHELYELRNNITLLLLELKTVIKISDLINIKTGHD